MYAWRIDEVEIERRHQEVQKEIIKNAVKLSELAVGKASGQ